jgi:hypothetical protein
LLAWETVSEACFSAAVVAEVIMEGRMVLRIFGSSRSL